MQNKPYVLGGTGVLKRGEGGFRHLGKIPKISRFLGGGGVPNNTDVNFDNNDDEVVKTGAGSFVGKTGKQTFSQGSRPD